MLNIIQDESQNTLLVTPIAIPHFSLILLIGPAGIGKTTFARQHFASSEIISSDQCRAMITNSENDQTVSSDAFEMLYQWAAKRLRYGRLTVIDATNTTALARQPLINMAQKHGASAIAMVFDLDVAIALQQNLQRERRVPDTVIQQQSDELRRDALSLWHEGFEQIHHFRTSADITAVALNRRPSRTDWRHVDGPFDIIGDIHGCFDELLLLLDELGYQLDFIGPNPAEALAFQVRHPQHRKVVFLGDVCDRGPMNHQVLRLVMDLVDKGQAIAILGNHEAKLRHYLLDRPVKPTHGLQQTIDNLETELVAFRQRILRFIDNCWPHLVLDDGRLVVAHAGLAEILHGFEGSRARQFALYGDVQEGKDEFGLPIRKDWAMSYRGNAKVVYGHTPVKEAVWRFGTLCLDTGCVFGGKLSALSYPEGQITSVAAKHIYFEPVKPLDSFSDPHRGS